MASQKAKSLAQAVASAPCTRMNTHVHSLQQQIGDTGGKPTTQTANGRNGKPIGDIANPEPITKAVQQHASDPPPNVITHLDHLIPKKVK